MVIFDDSDGFRTCAPFSRPRNFEVMAEAGDGSSAIRLILGLSSVPGSGVRADGRREGSPGAPLSPRQPQEAVANQRLEEDHGDSPYDELWRRVVGQLHRRHEPAGLSNCGDSQISDHPHGSSTRSRVPPPAGLSRRRAPPMAATRSLMPARPVPRHMSAPPCPSSATSTTRRPSST